MLKRGEIATIGGTDFAITEFLEHKEVVLCLNEPEEVRLATACNGCYTDGKCLPIGIRTKIGLEDKYCDTKTLTNQKVDNSPCQNNYECLSNLCGEGNICKALEKEVKQVKEEVEQVKADVQETKSLVQRIVDFLKKFFGFGE